MCLECSRRLEHRRSFLTWVGPGFENRRAQTYETKAMHEATSTASMALYSWVCPQLTAHILGHTSILNCPRCGTAITLEQPPASRSVPHDPWPPIIVIVQAHTEITSSFVLGNHSVLHILRTKLCMNIDNCRVLLCALRVACGTSWASAWHRAYPVRLDTETWKHRRSLKMVFQVLKCFVLRVGSHLNASGPLP